MDRKIASIGLEIKHGISMHGIALNINNDMMGFHAIEPCGIANVSMTSMKDHLAPPPTVRQAGLQLAKIFYHGWPIILRQIIDVDQPLR